MKLYTSKEQTAKLRELGFKGSYRTYITMTENYSIGELIEMLQKRVYEIEYSGIPCDLNIHYDGTTWLILFICESEGRFKTEMFELIDALYLMIIKLKEEGVI